MIEWCDHKAITLWMGSKFETTPERCFSWCHNINQIGFIVYICDAHKMLYLCNQKRNCDSLSKLCISSVSGECRNFCWENFGFWVSLVIVTLVNSRDGLVELLLWSFVIAPLRSFSLNFCKGTITVIVQNTVVMQCSQFG